MTLTPQFDLQRMYLRIPIPSQENAANSQKSVKSRETVVPSNAKRAVVFGNGYSIDYITIIANV